MAPYMFEG